MQHIRPGSIWVSHRSRHSWVVEALGETLQSVHIEPKKGPSGRRRNRHHIDKAKFFNEFVEIGSKRTKRKGQR